MEERQCEELEQEVERKKEAQRVAARRRWDRKNMVSIGTKLRPKYAKQFRECCEAMGTTPYRQIQTLVRNWTKDAELLPSVIYWRLWNKIPRS